MTSLLLIPDQNAQGIKQSKLYVSWDKDLKGLEKQLGKNDTRLFLKIFEASSIKPKKSLTKLEELRQRNANIPEIENLLAYLLIRLRKRKKAEQLISSTFENNPHHLISRINYADHCLRKKNTEKFLTTFEHSHDLKILYPSRETFHVGEYRGFMLAWGHFYLMTAEPEKADVFLYLAKSVDPTHSGVKHLEKRLYNKFYKKGLLKKLILNFSILLRKKDN